MQIRLNRDVTTYLKQKKVVVVPVIPVPKYEMGTLHPHSRPVTPLPALRPVVSPGNHVVTEAM